MFKPLLAALALSFSAPAMAATVVPILNASFEQATVTNGSLQTLAAGSTALPGWTIGGGGIDVVGTLWGAADGSRSLELNGTDAGFVSQTVTGLITGRSYLLTFSMSANRVGAPNNKQMRVQVGSIFGNFSFNRNNTTYANMVWATNSLTFTAAAQSTLLRFSSRNTGTVSGPALDNVRLTLVPVSLPGTLSLMLGGLAGLAALRRMRASKAAPALA